MNTAIPFKFGTDIEDGLSLRTNYKTTPKWAWLWSRDQFRNSGTPLTTLGAWAL